jgi:3-phenylpropionate/trans-cinnamate dioxygenase ferredoxin subunit
VSEGKSIARRIARLDDFPPDGLLAATLADGTPVCLVRHDDRVYALHDRCTHAEYSLSAGELLPDGTVQCLWHGATFDCRTGGVCRGPATEPVRTFAVRVVDGEVWVDGGTGNGDQGTDAALDEAADTGSTRDR